MKNGLIRLLRRFPCMAVVAIYSCSVHADVMPPQSIEVNAIASASEVHSDYCLGLLQLALNASRQPGENLAVKFTSLDYSQARLLAEVRVRRNSVAWSMSDQERDSNMRLIPVPLYKGLLGKRVLVIRRESQQAFNQVKTASDLKIFVAGQGAQWPDTRILRENGLQVVSSLESNLLLRMIKGKRFDYYPRSVVEAWYELAQLNDDDLAIEDHLLLSYAADLFFYVQRDNVELANRIETGLKILIRNGEFDRYFYSDSRIQQALQKLNAPGRITIELSNSQLNDAIATSPDYWLRLGAN